MNETLLESRNIHLTFGGVVAVSDLSFSVPKGQIFAIIGPNGAGKTCVINSISGFYRPQSGDIYFRGKNITNLPPHVIPRLGIARTFQNIELFSGLPTVQNLMAARQMYMKYNIFSSAWYFGRGCREEASNRRIVEEVIDFLGIQAVRETIVSTLPYGIQKMVELGRALCLEPTLLLLDEIMAGMNIEEKEDMSRFIIDVVEERGVTVVLVEHDMGVVMDLANKIIVMDFGHKIAEGTPLEIKTDSRVIKAYLGAEG